MAQEPSLSLDKEYEEKWAYLRHTEKMRAQIVAGLVLLTGVLLSFVFRDVQSESTMDVVVNSTPQPQTRDRPTPTGGRADDMQLSDDASLSAIQNTRSLVILSGLALLWALTLGLVAVQKRGYETYARRLRAIERRHGVLLPAERQRLPGRGLGAFTAYYLILAVSGSVILALRAYAKGLDPKPGAGFFLAGAGLIWFGLQRESQRRELADLKAESTAGRYDYDLPRQPPTPSQTDEPQREGGSRWGGLWLKLRSFGAPSRRGSRTPPAP